MRWIEAVADASISASWCWIFGLPELAAARAARFDPGVRHYVGPLPIDTLEAGPAWPALHPTYQVVLENLRLACQAL